MKRRFVIIAMAVLLACICSQAWAYWDFDPPPRDVPHETVMELGTEYDLSFPKEMPVVAFKFVPATDGMYVAESKSDSYARVALYDEHFDIIAIDGGEGYDYNFRFIYRLIAGETYYYYFSSNEDNAPYKVTLSMTEPDTNGFVYKYDKDYMSAKLVGYVGESTTVVIPKSIKDENGDDYRVTEISRNAFTGSRITRLTIPGSVRLIELEMFSGCDELEHIEISGFNDTYTTIDGVLLAYGEAIVYYPPARTGSDYKVPIGSLGTMEIAHEAFKGAKNLERVIIHDEVDYIKPSAFNHSPNLKEITVGANNSWYKSVAGVLFTKDGMDLITYPRARTETEYTVPDGVERIYSFINCKNLTSVTIPRSVSYIHETAFSQWKPGFEIRGYAGTEASEFAERHGIPFVSIDDMGLDGCVYDYYDQNMTCTLIGYAGTDEDLDIPETVNTDKGVYTVTGIGYRALVASKVENLTIPKTVTDIHPNAFGSVNSLKNVYIVDDNPIYDDIDGVLVSKDGRELIYYPQNRTDTEYTIPPSITKIKHVAFIYAEALKRIVFHSGVTQIEGALYDVTVVAPIGSYAQHYVLDTNYYRCVFEPDGVYNPKDIAVNQPETIAPSDFKVFKFTCPETGTYRLRTIGDVYARTFIYDAVPSLIEHTPYYINDFLTYLELQQGAVLYILSYPGYTEESFQFEINNISLFTDGNIQYLIGSDGNAYVKGYTGLPVDVSIQEKVTIGGIEYPVAGISERAFYECASIRSVTIPASVAEIGDYAFFRCANLETATISPGVQSIGQFAFRLCEKLDNVVIPNSVTFIGDDAFGHCESLTSMIIPPDAVIGDGIFMGCINLLDVTISPGVTRIGHNMFEYCSKLQNVSIPSSVTQIGEGAFHQCKNLQSIAIPAGVTNIGGGAFRGCSGLTSIILPEGIKIINEGTFAGCKALTSVFIPDGVTAIEGDAFNDCARLSGVTIPQSVTELGFSVFYNCVNIKTITIPEKVTSIGDWAFYGCANLTSINIPAGLKNIPPNAFFHCSSLQNINIANGVKEIGESAFSSCVNLQSVTIPESVTSIGTSLFFNCKNLESVSIPESITYIENNMFDSCASLSSLQTTRSLAKRALGASKSTGISITIPDTITGIGEYAFYKCASFGEVVVPSSVSQISPCAFSGCGNLERVTIPASVVRIGADAFADCAEGLTIYGFTGSAAQAYANKNGIAFVALEAVTGDVNADGVVDDKDVQIVLKHISGLVTLNPDQFERADVNKDNAVNNRDAVSIYRMVGQS